MDLPSRELNLEAPPHLLPGRSAFWWNRLYDRLTLVAILGMIGFVPIMVVLSWDNEVVAQIVLPASVAGVGCVIVAVMAVRLIFLHRARRERDHGYTSLPGDAVREPRREGRVFLFSTLDLWQLDPDTGAVVRRPSGSGSLRGSGRRRGLRRLGGSSRPDRPHGDERPGQASAPSRSSGPDEKR